MGIRIKDYIEGRFMKKLLLTCLIVGIIFVAGCIGEEKSNSKSSIDSQSSELLIKPSDLPKGYLTGGYTTYAISKGNSFDIGPNFEFDFYGLVDATTMYYSSDDKYEGDIPEGKKRIVTTFSVAKEDKSHPMVIIILESDSNSRLKEYISTWESDAIEEGRELKTNFVGDNSVLFGNSLLIFTLKNYVVFIFSYSRDGDEKIEVAKAIEKGLD